MLTLRLLAATLFALAASCQAQTAPAAVDHAAHHPPAASATAAAAAPTSEGEVRKIDKAQGKVTLKHGPIQNLDMPPMTMVFRVSDARLLDGLKEGDKVRFAAEQVNGALTLTAVEPATR